MVKYEEVRTRFRHNADRSIPYIRRFLCTSGIRMTANINLPSSTYTLLVDVITQTAYRQEVLRQFQAASSG